MFQSSTLDFNKQKSDPRIVIMIELELSKQNCFITKKRRQSLLLFHAIGIQLLFISNSKNYPFTFALAKCVLNQAHAPKL